MYTYLLLNILTFAVTFIFSFDKRIGYFSKWKKYIVSTTIVAIFMLIWDYIFTEMGVWGFNDDYLTGIFIGPLPIEEVLFFFTIPYSSLFIYEVIKYFIHSRTNKKVIYLVLGVFSITLFTAALLLNQNLYSYTTFIFLAILIVLTIILKPRYLEQFFIAFGITIIPFLIVNGILTSGIDSISSNPIVWYNDAENSRVRIGTIPVEDLFYGLFMLSGNYLIYEKFLNKETKD